MHIHACMLACMHPSISISAQTCMNGLSPAYAHVYTVVFTALTAGKRIGLKYLHLHALLETLVAKGKT